MDLYNDASSFFYDFYPVFFIERLVKHHVNEVL